MNLPPKSGSYARHDPTESLLYGLVQEHLESFLREAREGSGAALPKYVESEFRGFLACGVLACGFGRCRCADCGFDRLVAFSCKLRGVCPSCGQRRMAETAAELVDTVLPAVAVRQWVLSLPYELRLPVARDPGLLTRVSRTFFEEIRRWLRETSGVKATQGEVLQTGAVTAIQRFGGALNLNPHLHVLVLDGVYLCPSDGSSPEFIRGRAPTPEDLAGVVRRVMVRLGRLRVRGDGSAEGEAAGDAQGALVGCERVASQGGFYAKLGDEGQDETQADETQAGENQRFGRRASRGLVADVAGFNLHAGVCIAEGDRAGLERLCRYVARPAVSLAKLSKLEDGRIAYRVKPERMRGKTHLILEPMELMARLSAIIPPPRYPLVRYHGVLAPNSPWRATIVPGPRATRDGCGTHAESAKEASAAGVEGAAGERPKETVAAPSPKEKAKCKGLDWATLLHRVWGVDALGCERCGGRMKFIAVIRDRAVITKILAHLGLPTEVPRASKARAPPANAA